ncbi:hypothetical protein PBAL39_01502 [Pedobacter sp. BAL39]|uniref:TylF/MycF/NovP-related O-methyltransferase n=1 Tax=Pedobacter sp. BAL39 TaxID=391596 RepID=UPI00015595D0|nr:TylF/MycF/NovP-related O-methyltransferase [Pedobacter sp. BAL39]EDM38249.1 hypothetical protein PBAL39_01502 [Pedobacter sp. BAL39]
MDNYFITRPPYSKIRMNKGKASLIRFINKGFRYLKLGLAINPIDTAVDMNTIEQRINYFHLLDQVIANDIDGDVIELGCFTGQCALILQKVIEQRRSPKQLYLYDSFDIKFRETGSIEEVLKNNFVNAGLKVPLLKKGFFEETLPTMLPEKISFAHIDCGFGGDKIAHSKVVQYCLNEIYPKMSLGAICVLMDYNDPEINGVGHDANPGVKIACDEFLKDKPEEMVCLYGNQFFHAYFRKL